MALMYQLISRLSDISLSSQIYNIVLKKCLDMHVEEYILKSGIT